MAKKKAKVSKKTAKAKIEITAKTPVIDGSIDSTNIEQEIQPNKKEPVEKVKEVKAKEPVEKVKQIKESKIPKEVNGYKIKKLNSEKWEAKKGKNIITIIKEKNGYKVKHNSSSIIVKTFNDTLKYIN